MHFPGVREIKNIVICDPQVVFDSVTDLIVNSFTREKECHIFRDTGQFSLKGLQNIKREGASTTKTCQTSSVP